MSTLPDFKISSVSVNGTRIGYRSIGDGPGLLLVHGALQSSLNFTTLAKALSADFTVHIPDRRGRGLSDAYRENDDLLTEAADILALAHATGSQAIFGLSSGAIITLQAALMEPVFKKIAVYEPPIPLNDRFFKQLDKQYGSAMSKGNPGKAFVAILKGTGDTSFFSKLPAFITAPLVNVLMRSQLKNPKEDELPLTELVATFYQDRIVVKNSAGLIAAAKNITANVLLMGGAKSQSYFTPVLDQLQAAIPGASRVVFKKSGHLGPDNSGEPLKVAEELRNFFLG